MNATKLIKLAASGFGVALVLAGCGSSSPDNSNSSTGGSSASGGAPGSGGTESSGGESGTGGSKGSGGMMGAGGMMDSGGAMATGGKSMGGMMGAGGMMDSGGAMAMGGMSAGGMMGMGGKTGAGAGGMMGMGGKTGAGAGGMMGMGGMPGMGGTTGGGSGGPMTLTSPDQADGAKFGTEFTCAAKNGTFGAGVNPELNWDGVPDGTNSFAMTFIDTKLGASSAMGQHWAIWNIPKTVRQLPKGTTTLSGDLQTALQTNKYLAPCPSGDDTYEFTLYALSEASLTISGASGTGTSNSAGVAKVLTALQGVKPLATAVLHGTSGPKGQ